MSDQNSKKKFAEILQETIGLSEDIQVYKGILRTDMSDEGDAYIYRPDEDDVHISAEGRQDIIHGREFMGQPRTIKYRSEKAHFGITAGREVYYTQPKDTGRENPHSSFWVLDRDLDVFLGRLERNRSTVAAFKANNDSEDSPDWVGFITDFIRQRINDSSFDDARFEVFEYFEEESDSGDLGEWVDTKDPREDELLVSKILHRKQSKPSKGRGRRKRKSSDSEEEPKGLNPDRKLSPCAEASKEQLGPVKSDGSAEVDDSGNDESAPAKSGGPKKGLKALRREKPPKLADAKK